MGVGRPPAGTQLFEDSTSRPYLYDDHLYFAKITGGTSSFSYDALYKSDGTPAGTALLQTLNAGSSRHWPHSFLEAGGKAYFMRNFDRGGALYIDNDLWTTDGTMAGTEIIKHINSTPLSVFDPAGLVALNDAVYFTSLVINGEDEEYRLFKVSDPIPSKVDKLSPAAIQVSVYPNPTTSVIHIQSDEAIEKINLYTISGTLAYTGKDNSFSIGHLPPGIYLLDVGTKNGNKMLRLVKQ